MIGIPSWTPFKIVKEGLAARSRLLDEMEVLYRRIDQAQRGEPVDADMSDVSSAAFERNKVYEREKWSFRQRAGGELAISGAKMPILIRCFSGFWPTSIQFRAS